MTSSPTLKDFEKYLKNEKGVSPSKLNAICSDDDLLSISVKITKWEELAPYFHVEASDIKGDNHTVKTQRHALLTQWKIGNPLVATYKALVSIFLKGGRADLAQEVCDTVAKKPDGAVGGGPGGKIRAEGSGQLEAEEDIIEICSNDDKPIHTAAPNEPPSGQEAIIVTDRSRMWTTRPTDIGSIPNIRVFFMDGIPVQKNWIKENDTNMITTDFILETANEWHDCYPSVVPKFIPEQRREHSDIRITFKDEGQSHSAVGKDADKYRGNVATMTLNLGKAHQRRTILHEFGHALGLGHEQQRPDRPNDLYPNQPDGDAYEKYDYVMDLENEISFEYDVDSVMHYRNSVAKKYRREFRGTLSDGDREGIVKAYRKWLGKEEAAGPKRGKIQPEGSEEQEVHRPQQQDTHAMPRKTGKLSLDNDILPAKTVLKGLKKREIRDLFIELGLSDGTVEDCFETLGIDEYTHELLRHWINEKDDVGTKWKGGATWENLKAAMIKLKYGQEKNI